MSSSFILTIAFAAALIASLSVKLWLASRQIRHVARHRDAVPAAFAQTITLAAHQKAADYTVTKARVGLLEMAAGMAVLLGWTLLGGLDALNQALMAWLGGGMLQQLALLGSFALIGALIDLPFTLYQTFVVEERFGFNKMTFRLWLGDLAKSTAVGVVIGLPITALILWLMGAAGSYWWLWAWAVWMGFNLLLLVIYPTFIAPIFKQVTSRLKTSRSRHASRRSCSAAASRPRGCSSWTAASGSAHANAYFTGFGTAKRVVFYDTLLAKLSPRRGSMPCLRMSSGISSTSTSSSAS